MKDVIEGLKKVRSLIEAGWRQHAFAGYISPDGVMYDRNPYSTSANCFCLRGAMNRLQWSEEIDSATRNDIHEELNHGLPYGIVAFNDHPYTTKETVLNHIDKTIERISA